MTIRLDTFSNSIPKLSAHLLPNEKAQTAENVYLHEGTLKAMPSCEYIRNMAQAGELRSVYLLDTYWLAWTTEVDVVKAQVPDSDGRIFFTGDGYPKQTNVTLATSGAESSYPTSTRKLGVTPPAAALVVGILGTGDGEVGDSISYYYTYVTAWGEESAPSPATGLTTLEGGQYVRLSNFVKPTLAASGNDIAYFRLYRAVSGASGNASYQLVKARPASSSASAVYDIPVGSVPTTGTYVYDSNKTSGADGLNDELGESCPCEDWDVPPSDLEGLVQFQNGVLAGFSGNTVYLSEPMIPYAYPEANQYTVDEDIVAIGVHKSNLIIATESYPTILQGSNPGNMSQIRLPFKHGCLSKKGLVSTPIGVIYPCSEGLILLDGSTRTILTKGIWTKEQWNDLNPETLVGFFYEEKYIGFFQGTGTGFVLDLDDLSGCRSLSITGSVYGGLVDTSTGRLILLIKNSVYRVEVFDSLTTLAAGTLLNYTWHSKKFTFQNEFNYAAAKIKGDYSNGSVTFKLYADGTLVHTETVNSDDFFWLGEGGYRASEWEFELIGKSEIKQVRIVQSVKELARG